MIAIPLDRLQAIADKRNVPVYVVLDEMVERLAKATAEL